MPPCLTGRITYDPPLPRERNQVPQRTPMGAVVKVRPTGRQESVATDQGGTCLHRHMPTCHMPTPSGLPVYHPPLAPLDHNHTTLPYFTPCAAAATAI